MLTVGNVAVDNKVQHRSHGSLPGWPDWANFSSWASYILGTFMKITQKANFLEQFFSEESFVKLHKIWIRLHFGRFFRQKHLVTLLVTFSAFLVTRFDSSAMYIQGCQIFFRTKYQNGKNIPNFHKVY
jgi:hypothetical protein